jgi:hypothetical protein
MKRLVVPVALVTLAIGLHVAPAAAQQQTYFDTEGRVDKPDLFETDGFRPVWQQQLMEQRAKEAAAAAEAAKQNGQTGTVITQPAPAAQPKGTATSKAKP